MDIQSWDKLDAFLIQSLIKMICEKIMNQQDSKFLADGEGKWETPEKGGQICKATKDKGK